MATNCRPFSRLADGLSLGVVSNGSFGPSPMHLVFDVTAH